MSEQQAGTLRFGFVGLGTTGRFHVENVLRHPGTRCVIAWDAAAQQREWASSRVETIAPDAAAVLHHPDLSAVCIALPVAERAAHIVAALTAGQTVLSAVPWGVTGAELEQIKLAEVTGPGRLGRLSPLRPLAAEQAVKNLISSGKLGEIHTVEYIAQRYAPVAQEASSPATLPARVLDEAIEALRAYCSWWPTRIAHINAWAEGADGTDLVARLVDVAGRVCWVRISHARAFPATTGWALHGKQGSYTQGQVFSPAADGELIDGTLTLPAHDPLTVYQTLTAALSGADWPVVDWELELHLHDIRQQFANVLSQRQD